MNPSKRNFKYGLLALTVSSLMVMPAWADDTTSEEDSTDLGELTVTTTKPKTQGKLGERIVSRQQLNQENIQNAHDLVRYNTEVDVAEVGRYGNKGFAVRGVDGNRVAMSVDGVALPEVESNELFSPYGYMYEGRFSPDLEMMGSVRVTAGADSVASGSGAVGGAISYMTKEPYHLVRGDKRWGGYAKLGYTNKNEERLTSVGLAGIYDRAEFLLSYSRREGSELKNHNMRQADKARLDSLYAFSNEEMPCVIGLANRCRYNSSHSLIYPNPMSYKRDSVLAKFYYHLGENHRIGLHGLHQKQDSITNTESMTTSSGGNKGSTTRRAFDKEEMKSYGLSYYYLPSTGLLSEVEVNYNKSDILGLADTWIYNRTWVCPDGRASFWCDSTETKLAQASLFNKEYQPTRTKSDQYSLDLKFLPVDFGKMGEHELTVSADYTKSDFTQDRLYLHATDPTRNHISFVFADVKKDIYNISLVDSIRFNDRLRAMVAVRYDNHKYNPYWQDDVGGFSENAKNREICTNPSRFTGTGYLENSLYCQNYRNGKDLEPVQFGQMTYAGLLDYVAIPNRLAARYKVGTGFLAPNTTQLYSKFSINEALQVPNYNLKPETSLNQELELEIRPTKNTVLTLSGYVSKYDNFIHSKYYSRDDTKNGGTCTGGRTCLQSVNLDEAEVRGLKVGLEADLSEPLKTSGKFSVSANYHTAKDSALIETDHNGKLKINTLAATPTSLILGADYVSADNSWSIHGRVRGIMRKRAEDTKFVDTEDVLTPVTRTQTCFYWYDPASECPGYTYDPSTRNYVRTVTVNQVTGYNEVVNTFKHVERSKSVIIYDLYATKKFGKNHNFILNGGIYNITDVKYIPWESLRQFNNFTVNNMVDSNGSGFNRYTAPGRNYAISLTYEF